MNGWIKLHRKIIEWEWYYDTNTFRVFLHLLLKANHTPILWRDTLVKQGQIIVSRRSLAKQLRLSEQKVRTALLTLKSTHEITIQSTHRFSLITLVNWAQYQTQEKINPLINPLPNPQTNHKQEYKKKEIKNNTSEPSSQEDMKHYNENQHYEDLPSVVDGELQPLEPKKRRNTEYRKVFDLWDDYPVNWRVNTTEIQAAKNLLEESTIDDMRKMLTFYEKHKSHEFCPKILKPSDLDRKWENLLAFKQKYG